MAALERLVALCERIAVMAREQAVKERRQGDEELAGTYRRVERRIVDLVREEALRILNNLFGISREEIAERAPLLLEPLPALEGKGDG